MTHIAIALLVVLVAVGCRDHYYNDVCREIEQIVSERDKYFSRQMDLINIEKQRLQLANNERTKFEICYRIFNLSRSYKYDIAYKYAEMSLKLAEEIGEADLVALAKGALISTYTSGGLFTRASETLHSTESEGVSNDIRRELYYNFVRYYSDLIDYANNSDDREIYAAKLHNYADSIIQLSPNEDYYYAYANSSKSLMDNDLQSVVKILTTFNKNQECSPNHNAIISYMLGCAYFAEGDERRGFEHMTLSVKYDVEAAVRENRSMKTIAEKLFEVGHVGVAEQLIEIAYEDAIFYNARHRNLEVNAVLPIINRDKIQSISQQRNVLYALILLISLLTIMTTAAGFMARRKAREAKQAKRTIKAQMDRLTQINDELMEANRIKEHYIIDSLYKGNEHLNQIEAMLKKIDVKVKNRLYDDLRYLYKDFNIKRKKESFFDDFDHAFLSLFPDFINEYNSLLQQDSRLDPTCTRVLPPEVRIFALMRLGITEVERISRFLDLSVNTIYTYKTKVKSRAIVPKEEFENRILHIRITKTED